MSKFYRQQLKILNDIESLENEIKELVYNSVTSYMKQENEKELENINICSEKFAKACSTYFLADLLKDKMWSYGGLTYHLKPIGLCDFAVKKALEDVSLGEVAQASDNLQDWLNGFCYRFRSNFAREFPLSDIKLGSLLEDVNKINEERGQKDEA